MEQSTRRMKHTYIVAALLVSLLVQHGNDSFFLVEGKKSSSARPVPASRRASPSSSRRSAPSSSKRRGPPPKTARRPSRRIEEEEDDDMFFGMEEEEEEEEDVADTQSDFFDEEEEEEEEVLKPIPASRRTSRGVSSPRGGTKQRPKPRRSSSRTYDDFDAYDDEEGTLEEDEEYEEDYDEDYHRPPRPASRRTAPPSKRAPNQSTRGHPGSHGRGGYDARGRRSYPSPRGSRGRGRTQSRRNDSSAVVPYVGKAAGTFSRGLAALKESMPDPTAVRERAGSAFLATKESTLTFSRGLYREVKGLTSSELEQVMLKATRPDDMPVKGKHVERLVGVTYQISPKYDIYDSVLRKLWKKMVEPDWRTKIKSVYVLHRFSADGSPDHQPALKARLRELRRTKDPKKKEKYFNSKQLLAGELNADHDLYRAFLARYAHYVLLRAQCFGGMFAEIAPDEDSAPPPSSSKKSKQPPAKKASPPSKPITSTALRPEHLEAARLLLKAGCACGLREGEECENNALAVERVASDMMSLTAAVAIALNRALKSSAKINKGMDEEVVKRWCEFYKEELLPQTKAFVRKTSPKLDAYGLFLPSRMGATVSADVLAKGLQAGETKEEAEGAALNEARTAASKEAAGAEEAGAEEEASPSKVTVKSVNEEPKKAKAPPQPKPSSGSQKNAEAPDEEYEEEYEYDEYYDEEDEV